MGLGHGLWIGRFEVMGFSEWSGLRGLFSARCGRWVNAWVDMQVGEEEWELDPKTKNKKYNK